MRFWHPIREWKSARKEHSKCWAARAVLGDAFGWAREQIDPRQHYVNLRRNG